MVRRQALPQEVGPERLCLDRALSGFALGEADVGEAGRVLLTKYQRMEQASGDHDPRGENLTSVSMGIRIRRPGMRQLKATEKQISLHPLLCLKVWQKSSP